MEAIHPRPLTASLAMPGEELQPVESSATPQLTEEELDEGRWWPRTWLT